MIFNKHSSAFSLNEVKKSASSVTRGLETHQKSNNVNEQERIVKLAWRIQERRGTEQRKQSGAVNLKLAEQNKPVERKRPSEQYLKELQKHTSLLDRPLSQCIQFSHLLNLNGCVYFSLTRLALRLASSAISFLKRHKG